MTTSGSHLTMSQFATRLDFERAQAEHTGKQLVQYSQLQCLVELGKGVSVIPVDHPDTFNVTNGRSAWTSPVEWYNADTGVFQTANTRYVPESLGRIRANSPGDGCG